MKNVLEAFKAEQPIASRIFSGALQYNQLAHAYVLKGRCLPTMYQLTLALAQHLNCMASQKQPGEVCGQCRNCHWIEQNSHPSVITLSRLTYLAEEGKTSSKKASATVSTQTQIKGEQLDRLLQQLGHASADVRVVVFTDAEEVPGGEAPAPAEIHSVLPPFDWRTSHESTSLRFELRPLNKAVFNTTSANRFLKTLEEPSPRTLFFFLTDSEANLLGTIVSRCQVVPFKTLVKTTSTTTSASLQLPAEEEVLLQRIFEVFKQPGVPIDSYKLLEDSLNFFVKEAGLSHLQLVERLQREARARFLTPSAEMTAISMQFYQELQNKLEQARKMLKAKTHADLTLHSLLNG